MASESASQSINGRIQSILQDIDAVSKKNSTLIKDLETIEGKANEQDATQMIDSLKDHLKASTETNLQLQKTLEDQSAALKEDLIKLSKQQQQQQQQQQQDEEKKRTESWQTVNSNESELSSQLKVQMTKNVELQNAKMKTELALHERIEALKLLGETNKRLQADVNTSRNNSQKVLRLFDKKAKEAEKRLTEMEDELKRSQEVSKKYQDLYEAEKRKNVTKANTGQNHSETQGDSKDGVDDEEEDEEEGEEDKDGSDKKDRKKRASSAKQKVSVSYSDLQRKYQTLLDENGALKEDTKRLKYENEDLYKRAKEAGSCLQILKSQVATSFADREKLQKQLRKQKLEQQKLERSMTRQVKEWIEDKKQQHREEEEYRWSQINPVSASGAEKRTYVHPVTKQEDTPRDIPVAQWADSH
ncbi:uncharacterized protein LOC144439495 isoform X1 [Glandiceps talaboti]